MARVVSKPITVNLELDMEEARFLFLLSGCVAGKGPKRSIADRIYDAFAEAKIPVTWNDPEFEYTGSITFKGE